MTKTTNTMTVDRTDAVSGDALGQSLTVPDAGTSVFERLARDPTLDPAKLEHLMNLFERNQLRQAELAFNAALTRAQADMRPVAADSDNSQTRSRYASYEALDRALRAIYTAHGFGLSFNTGDGAPEQYVRVMCLVTHIGGFSRSYHIDMPADGKGAKGGDVMTKTHATGSAVSYGMRYLLKMIFNVAVGEDDDDGNKAGGREEPAEPHGYREFVMDITAKADEGFEALMATWKGLGEDARTDPKLRAKIMFLVQEDGVRWDRLKQRAELIDKKAKARK